MKHSLTNILTTKKFFKQFSKKKQTSSTITIPPKKYKPTYQIIPKQKFNSQHIHKIIKKLINNKLNKIIYNKK